MKILHAAACAALLIDGASLAAQAPAALAAQAPAPLAALARMPVKEVTVFKDGHAFVLHEGTLPTDAAGNVLMDYLPSPVLGTFWPYSANPGVKLAGVVAGQRRVLVEQTALSLAELLDGNAGAEAIITEKTTGPNREPVRYACTIIGIPQRSSEELATTGLPNAAPRTPEKGSIILVRTSDGVKAVIVENIQDVTFKTPHKSKLSHEEFRNLLTLKLEWGSRKPGPTAQVGLVYLQNGLRWIPGYRATLDGNGNAAIKLQTTLVNELADLTDVTAHLVIGVPSFAFKDTMDPVALQQTVGQLSPYFQPRDRMSNAISGQMVALDQRSPSPAPAGPGLGPELPESTKSEDLFVFTVRNVTMRKGERMVAAVAEYTLPYTDVFSLDLPFAPPPDVQANLNTEQEAEMARLFSAPKVAHKARFTNKSSYPLTTAPALIVRDNRVLAQGLMTYTAVNASSDLEITKAVDIQVAKSDAETGRVPSAARWQGDDYARVDLTGTIKLTNYRDNAVDIEVTRHVLGNVTGAGNGGVVTKVNVFEDGSYMAGDSPRWWRWYQWPNWWPHFNGVGRINWKIRIEPGKSADLGYTWHYFWR
jgi:hypothetical protein